MFSHIETALIRLMEIGTQQYAHYRDTGRVSNPRETAIVLRILADTIERTSCDEQQNETQGPD